MIMQVEPFRWMSFDVSSLLPKDWQEAIVNFTRAHMHEHIIQPTSETSRESDPSVKIPTLVVSGSVISDKLPWLYEFYRGPALNMMQQFYSAEKLVCARDPLYAVNLQAAYDVDDTGTPMRYERHVDWAPTGLLYVTSHPKGSGGELVVSNDTTAQGEAIDKDAVRIYPKAGQLICIDAREYPHYVEPLKAGVKGSDNERQFRVVVVMLFCTDDNGSCPESSRPAALDEHLGHKPDAPHV